ncbi:MAG: phosphoglycerate kinase [Acidobacteriia bacterium]|nr:phosphoglycerate kinase [Methyloceanibacter sp.]MCL6492876.1 phosphoglycerate kinase [Terriglobia bacterium]
MKFRTLDDVDVGGKRVLVRVDLNVPMQNGKITDLSRVNRVLPTIRELMQKQARVIVCSHFDRPKGKRVPSLSLAPLARALGEALGKRVRFAEDCIGPAAQQAVDVLRDGDVLLLENTRFHSGEEANDPNFARELASLAEIYVNDAFSAAHRAHASTEGVAHFLPAYAGRLMQAELEALHLALGNPQRPVAAIVGGAKISTKLALLGNLLERVEVLFVGGAMANTLLAVQGFSVGRSLQEPDLYQAAREIMQRAEASKCSLLMPVDAVIATELAPHVPTHTVSVDNVPEDAMILDIGPATVKMLGERLQTVRTVVWNGPLGAFETPPFHLGTVAIAKAVAEATQKGALRSIAGGGDTLAALNQAGVAEAFTYVSTAGGAFLEWLEGKTLPGVAALAA